MGSFRTFPGPTWRLRVSGVSAGGKWGVTLATLRVKGHRNEGVFARLTGRYINLEVRNFGNRVSTLRGPEKEAFYLNWPVK